MKTNYSTILFLLFLFGCNAQSQNREILTLPDVKNEIKDEKFYYFLKLFSTDKLPYNSKKQQQSKVKTFSLIPQNLLIDFLQIKKTDMYYETFDYNYDEDIISDKKTVLKKYRAQLSVLCKEYALLIYRCSFASGTGDDPCYYNHLVTFSYQGKMIDSLTIVNKNLNSGFKWDEYVLLSCNHFKLFRYDNNWDNSTKTGKIIDKKGFLNICNIEDYEIDNNGKIKKINTTKKYLKEESYNFYDPKKLPDDPINEY